jgi:UDP-N-acetylmuramoyl-L-alanyl-D-glutamate--2,6-diaminopimelate ligase
LKTLETLLSGIHYRQVAGSLEKQVQGLSEDSRMISENWMFVAVKGIQFDGHTFIEKAIAKGASVVVAEKMPEALREEVTYIQVNDSRKALGNLADAFFDHPSGKIQVVGVTGTNGKTSTVTLLYRLFINFGFKTGLLSTVENRIHESVIPATHTTPGPVQIHALLADMVNAGCDYAFMEVSSHAADQQRIAGVQFAGGVFTNITHDHLDYHKTFRNYIFAKKKFFDCLPAGAFALINRDDKRGEVMVQNTPARVYRYSLLSTAEFKAKVVEVSSLGLQLELDGKEFFSPLTGRFNAYNLLAVYAVAILLGRPSDEVLPALSELQSAEGRFEQVVDEYSGRIGIVDYAHTPDALEKALRTLDEINKGQNRILVVIGCGGDRDKAKRPEMTKIACAYAQDVILTTDNPRTEDPRAILKEMIEGAPAHAKRKVLVIEDRREAIRTSVRIARKGDLILIAGKGHEKYQEINGERFPFDDKAELMAAFSEENHKR